MLQYSNWRKVIQECHRILKPNGKAVFIENLEGNPIAKGYRNLHHLLNWQYSTYMIPTNYLRWDQRMEFTKIFSKAEFKAFNLLTPLILIIPELQKRFLIKGRERYKLDNICKCLHKVDSYLLAKLPRLKNYCWTIVVCATK